LEVWGLIRITKIVFTLIVLALYVLYVLRHRRLDELSRRFLLSGFFFGIHELTFFMGDAFIYELTKMLFFISLFYSLLFIVRQNTNLKKELEEQKARNKKLKERTEEIAESWLAEKKDKRNR
jgi:heme exporter protein D